jgi:hypothetical protein
LRKETYVSWWTNEPAVDDIQHGPRVLCIDIETSPIVAYVWGLYDQNVGLNQIVEDWEILCVCAKWLGSDEVMEFNSSPMYRDLGKICPKRVEDGEFHSFDELAEALWILLDEADAVVAHNAVKFDNKKIKTKLMLAGLPPPSPYKIIDTLKIARDQFGFTSNRKDFLSKKLGGDGKHDTGGMQLWIDCINGDTAAWDKMLEYCKNDVLELERIYLEIRSWDNKHPNLQQFYKDALERCGTCGSPDLKPEDNKFAHTNVSTFEVLRCQSCGALKRRRTNLRTLEQRKTTLMNIS